MSLDLDLEKDFDFDLDFLRLGGDEEGLDFRDFLSFIEYFSGNGDGSWILLAIFY